MVEAAQAMTRSGLQQLAFVRLDYICKSARFKRLDYLDALYACTQYDGLGYDWDGMRDGYADSALGPGWWIPYSRRKPRVKVRTGKFIVQRLSSMMLGEDRFPEISIEGDVAAEDYVKAIAEVAEFDSVMDEARTKGGACGAVALSYAFVEGEPRVSVHRAKHIEVLRWKDRARLVPAEVLKTYRYKRTVLDPTTGKPKQKDFYFAQYWDEHTEIIWDPISQEDVENRSWVESVRRYEVTHEYGECPVVWIQNQRNSDSPDGESDYDQLGDNICELDRLCSASSKGTVANVDPTLIIKDERTKNQGTIRKGSENAIWSKGGAEYLTLGQGAMGAAHEEIRGQLGRILDAAGVVSPEPEKLSGSAKSAAAMRVLYQPMTDQCDKLRTQYGAGMVRLLRGILRAAKQILNQSPGDILTTADGTRIQQNPTVVLPDRVETVKETTTRTKRVPGTSEEISIKWPLYFKATAQDENARAKTAIESAGTIITTKTAVRYTAQQFGVNDVEAELAAIMKERDDNAQRMTDMSGGVDIDRNRDEPDEDDDGSEES